MTSTLIVLSLPPKTFVGLDLVSFNSSPKFLGITKVPSGAHFLYAGTDASLSIRQGRWLNLSSNTESHVLRWNRATETLDLVDSTGSLAKDAASSASDGQGLVDYAALQDATQELVQASEAEDTRDEQFEQPAVIDLAETTSWPELTSHISSPLLNRVLSSEWIVSSVSSAPNDTESIPGLSHLEVSNVLDQLPLNLLPINLKHTWAAGDIGRLRTDRARDRSWFLSHLIETVAGQGQDKAVGARGILGELQFCFLMVLTLANYSCFEQWKRLLTVFFTCRAALDEVEGYFVEVLKVIHSQIKHVEDVEGGLFDLRDENASSWLRSTWARFRGVVDEADEGERKSLKDEVSNLQALFESKYGWQSERDILRRGMLELEDGERVEVTMPEVDEDEYEPVVVET